MAGVGSKEAFALCLRYREDNAGCVGVGVLRRGMRSGSVGFADGGGRGCDAGGQAIEERLCVALPLCDWVACARLCGSRKSLRDCFIFLRTITSCSLRAEPAYGGGHQGALSQTGCDARA